MVPLVVLHHRLGHSGQPADRPGQARRDRGPHAERRRGDRRLPQDRLGLLRAQRRGGADGGGDRARQEADPAVLRLAQGEFGLKDVFCGVPVQARPRGVWSRSSRSRSPTEERAAAAPIGRGGARDPGGGRRRRRATPMNRLAAFWDSSVGKKAVMAVTGLSSVCLLITHMLGNLQVFQGPDQINALRRLLHGPLAELLWAARVVLLVAVVLHVVAACQLTHAATARRGRSAMRERQPQVSTLASRTHALGRGAAAGVHHLHILHFTTGTAHPESSSRAIVYPTSRRVPHPLVVRVLSRRDGRRSGCICITAPGAAVRTLGVAPPSPQPLRRGWRWCWRCSCSARASPSCPLAVLARMVVRWAMSFELDAEGPGRPDRAEVGQPPLRHEAGQPANKRKYTVIVVGTGLAGALGGRHAERAGLQREVLLLPGLAPPGALHRGAGRHQRGQELPERRRQRLPPVLRHRQGRRLPLPRGQRLPPGPDQRQHHRPVRGAGRAVRARVRRAPGQPLVRRGAGLPHLLRPRPDRPAAAARRLSGAGEGDRARRGDDVPAHRDARSGRRSTGRPAASWSRDMVTGEIESHAGRRGRAGHRRLRQRVLPLHQRQGLQRHRHLAGPQARRGVRQPLLHPDPPDLHSGERRATSPSSR